MDSCFPQIRNRLRVGSRFTGTCPGTRDELWKELLAQAPPVQQTFAAHSPDAAEPAPTPSGPQWPIKKPPDMTIAVMLDSTDPRCISSQRILWLIDHGYAQVDTSVPYKSALDEAQANQIRVQGGWKSRQTVQQEEGLDPEREMQNIEEYNRRMGATEKQGPAQVQEANFNPNEPRDWRGRWAKASGLADDAVRELLSKDQLDVPRSPTPPEQLYTAAYEAPPEAAERSPAVGKYKGSFQKIPPLPIDHLVEIGLAQRSQAGYVVLVEPSPECQDFRRIILQPYTTPARSWPTTSSAWQRASMTS
jgi:hypothetical protein